MRNIRIIHALYYIRGDDGTRHATITIHMGIVCSSVHFCCSRLAARSCRSMRVV